MRDQYEDEMKARAIETLRIHDRNLNFEIELNQQERAI